MKSNFMRIISNILLAIAVIIGLAIAFLLATIIKVLRHVNNNNGLTFSVILITTIVLVVIVFLLIIVSFRLKNKYKQGSFGDLIHQDNLRLNDGWLVSGTQALQFQSIVFNNNKSDVTFFSNDNKVITSISFNDITKIRMNPNLRSPLFYIWVASEKYTVAFVKNTKDLKAFVGIASTIKVIGLGGVGTALSGISAVESSYGQIMNDKIETIHGWLHFHRIKAYKQVISRNLVILYIFLFSIILAITFVGVFIKVN